jgi:uncharacterized membrane protein YhiD involved in acid resistance
MDFFIDVINKMGVRTEVISALRLSFALVIGGVLALYIRFLYKRFSHSMSGTDSFTSIFPMLVLVTTTVIAVVKSSLALSLGLIGALSIVRFRAAIKEPEELVYLFLCIAVGISLGAGHYQLAVLLVFVASVFVIGRRFFGGETTQQNLMLTISGDSDRYFDDTENGVVAAIKELVDVFYIQRYDIEENQGIMRISIKTLSSEETLALVSGLKKKLPGCRISYVNMDTLL